MTAKTPSIFAAIILAILVVPSLTSLAYSQPYLGNVGEDDKTGVGTLEESLKLAREKVILAQENPLLGSGTPFLALDGLIGSSLVAGGIFGGITAGLFIKSRGGHYVAQGRG